MIWLDILLITLNSIALYFETRKGYIVTFSFLTGVLSTLLAFRLVMLWLS